MSHNHKHKCECEHENVKYCKACKYPHCVDCGQEWSGLNSWYKAYYQPYYPLYGNNTTLTSTAETPTAEQLSSMWQQLTKEHKCK